MPNRVLMPSASRRSTIRSYTGTVIGLSPAKQRPQLAPVTVAKKLGYRVYLGSILIEQGGRTGAHIFRQYPVEVGDLALLVRVRQGAAEAARFHAPLYPFHVRKVLRQHRAPFLRGGLGLDPFGFGFFAVREALQGVGLEDTLVRVVAVGAGAVAQGEGDALENGLVGEQAPGQARLGHLFRGNLGPDHAAL